MTRQHVIRLLGFIPFVHILKMDAIKETVCVVVIIHELCVLRLCFLKQLMRLLLDQKRDRYRNACYFILIIRVICVTIFFISVIIIIFFNVF